MTDREFWMEIRRARLTEIRAIEKRLGLEREADGEKILRPLTPTTTTRTLALDDTTRVLAVKGP